MAIKKFEDNSGHKFASASTEDLSHLGDGLNPFNESMAGGNTLSAKGPFQAPGSDSEQVHSVYGEIKEFDVTDDLGKKFEPKNKVK